MVRCPLTLVLMLALAGCGTPGPGAQSEPPGPIPPQKLSDLREGPVFTPFNVPPTILNEDEVRLATERFYPPHLREQGIGGTVRVYFLVDADGTVVRRVLDRGSGVPELDDAAMRVSEVYRFAPATNRDIPVPVWVSFAVTFGTN